MMNKPVLWMIAVAVLAVPVLASCREGSVQRVAGFSVQLQADVSMDDFRKSVADFAAARGFGKGQEATLPPTRKIFTVQGGFATTFPMTAEGYYLVMLSGSQKGCIAIEVDAGADDARYHALLDSLSQSLQQRFGTGVRMFPDEACGAPSGH